MVANAGRSRRRNGHYRVKLKYSVFSNAYYSSSPGTLVIEAFSIQSLPARALKYHARRSGVRIPSAYSQTGEPAYHRVINDVLVSQIQVVRQWPSELREPASHSRRDSHKRSRPVRDRADAAITQLYGTHVPSQAELPNKLLCAQVCAKLKQSGLPEVSSDTILRSARRSK